MSHCIVLINRSQLNGFYALYIWRRVLVRYYRVAPKNKLIRCLRELVPCVLNVLVWGSFYYSAAFPCRPKADASTAAGETFATDAAASHVIRPSQNLFSKISTIMITMVIMFW